MDEQSQGHGQGRGRGRGRGGFAPLTGHPSNQQKEPERGHGMSTPLAVVGGVLLGALGAVGLTWLFNDDCPVRTAAPTSNVFSSSSSRPPPQPSEDCPICREDFCSPTDILPCGHIYHIKCLRKWFETKHSLVCPLCNRPVDDKFIAAYKERLGI